MVFDNKGDFATQPTDVQVHWFILCYGSSYPEDMQSGEKGLRTLYQSTEKCLPVWLILRAINLGKHYC